MGVTPYPAQVVGPEYRFGDNRLPMVDVSAARGKGGKLYLALTNTDPHNAAHVVTNIKGRGRGRILSASSMDAYNSFAAPNALHPADFVASQIDGKLAIDLPAKSVVVLAIE